MARDTSSLKGVPDGTYEINASEMLPAFRPGAAVAKQQVIVSDGSVVDVLLTVDMPQVPGAKQ